MVSLRRRKRKLLALCSENNSCENLAHHENSSQNANPKSEQSVVPNVAICGELPSYVNQSEKAVQDFGAPEVLKLITTLEEKEAALVNLKKALEEKEAALMESDAALKDAFAREEKMKQNYPEVLKKITALEMVMTEQQKSVENKEATLAYLKKELVEMEAALMEMDAALKDSLAREKKVKQHYSEDLTKITALEMAMTEQQKSMEHKEADLVNLKKDLEDMEDAFTAIDAALQDALAREKKVKQDYRKIRKLITALKKVITAE